MPDTASTQPKPDTAARKVRAVALARGRHAGAATRVLRLVWTVTWVALQVAVIGGVIALAVAWRVYHLAPYAVTSGSMEPAIATGSLILVERVPASSVRAGDVITFDPPGPAGRVTHRVVDRARQDGSWYFTTKGDANPASDDWRRTRPTTAAGTGKGAVEGPGVSYDKSKALRVRTHVPYAGYLIELTHRPWLRRLLLGLPLLLLGYWMLRWIWARPEGVQEVARREAAEDVWADEGLDAA